MLEAVAPTAESLAGGSEKQGVKEGEAVPRCHADKYTSSAEAEWEVKILSSRLR